MKSGPDFAGRSFAFSKFASKNFRLTRLCNDMQDAEKIGVRKTVDKMFPRPSKKKLMIGKVKAVIKKVIMK